ncbi:MAG: alpha/beta fold hydrolase [Anaerolineae bacterium]|nr:alpha/beta fold hydrolase [Anaerolineae bacterium]
MKKWQGDLVFIALVVALVGGWFYLYPRPGTSLLSALDAPIDLDVEPRSYASPDGTALAYRLYEPPEEVEAVLVLLHDTLLHGAWYAELGYGLASRGVAVYVPDRRGWGHSDGDRQRDKNAADVLTQDLIALITAAHARYPQQHIYVGAHGRGAGIVLSYVAARQPTDGIVLIAPIISPDQSNLAPDGRSRWVMAHPIEAWLAQGGLDTWAVWRYNWPRTMVDADPLLETTCSIACEQETIPVDVDTAYQSVTVPLLCVQGEQDFMFDQDKIADLMAHFATQDRQAILVSGADYLSVLTLAADPIADWIEK